MKLDKCTSLLLATFTLALGYYLFESPIKTQHISTNSEIATKIPKTLLPQKTPKADLEITSRKTLVHNSKLNNKTLAKSLSGTDYDGALETDSKGHLKVNLDVRRRFEYFLSTYGELHWPKLVRNLRQHIRQELKEPALSEGLLILDNYLEWFQQRKTYVSDLDHSEPSYFIHAINEKMKFRRSFFTPHVAGAFFEFDDAYDRYMIKKLEIHYNQEATLSEKKQALNKLNQNPPPSLFGLIEEDNTYEIEKQVRVLQKSKASSEDIYHFRQSNYGKAAADRFVKLDEKRKLWRKRVLAYQINRREIEILDSKSDVEKNAMIAQLKKRHFSEIEILRVSSLGKIDGFR